MFPSSQILLTDTVDMKAVLRRTFIFLIFIVTCFVAFFALTSVIVVVAIAIYYRHHIHHLNWRLLKLLCSIAYRIQLKVIYKNGDSPMDYVFIILIFGVLGFVWLLLLRWAWNRRAERLNREPSLPQSALAVAPGVWPPPPNVPEGR